MSYQVQKQQPFKMNSEGFKLVRYFEGLRLKPYLDGGNKATIGWGNTFYENGTPVKLTDKPITKERAEELFQNILLAFNRDVKKLVTASLNQNQLAALTSLAYNIGIKQFKYSTVLRKVNSKYSLNEIETAFLMYKYDNGKVVQGLINRRVKEIELFKKKI